MSGRSGLTREQKEKIAVDVLIHKRKATAVAREMGIADTTAYRYVDTQYLPASITPDDPLATVSTMLEERRNTVRRLHRDNPSWSQRRLARESGMSHVAVGKILADPADAGSSRENISDAGTVYVLRFCHRSQCVAWKIGWTRERGAEARSSLINIGSALLPSVAKHEIYFERCVVRARALEDRLHNAFAIYAFRGLRESKRREYYIATLPVEEVIATIATWPEVP
jgi:hypothetical protein